MVDKEQIDAANRRHTRERQVMAELETTLEAGRDPKPLLEELEQLRVDGLNFAAGLVTEIEAENVIRVASLTVHLEEIRDRIESRVPTTDPRRATLLGLLARLEAGKPLTPAELEALDRLDEP